MIEHFASGAMILAWVSVGIYVYKKVPPGMFAFMVSVIFASSIINTALKALIKKERPEGLEKHSAKFYFGPQKYSFPSGHVQVSFTALALLEKFYPPITSVGLVLAILTSGVRFFLGRHTVSDILGGAIIGYAIGRIYINWMI
jgi:membrane-associated phospholipid phosphatase